MWRMNPICSSKPSDSRIYTQILLARIKLTTLTGASISVIPRQWSISFNYFFSVRASVYWTASPHHIVQISILWQPFHECDFQFIRHQRGFAKTRQGLSSPLLPVLCLFLLISGFSEFFNTLRCIKIKLNWSLLDLVEGCWIWITFDIVDVLKMVLGWFNIHYSIWTEITIFVSETCLYLI